MAQVKVNYLIDWLQRTQNGRRILDELIKDNIENRRNSQTANIPYNDLQKKRESAFRDLYDAYVGFNNNSGMSQIDRERMLKDRKDKYSELFFSMDPTKSTIEMTYLSLLAEKDREFMSKRTQIPGIVEELVAIQSFLENVTELSDIRPHSVVKETNAVENALEIANARLAASIRRYTDFKDFIGVVPQGKLLSLPDGPFELEDYLPSEAFRVGKVNGILAALSDLLFDKDKKLGDQYIDVGEK